MAFFKVSIEEDMIKDYEGGNSKWLTKSGIYDIIIKNAIVDVTKNGSEHINLHIEHEGQLQTLYQAIRTKNTDGSVNKIGLELLNKLCIVMGADASVEINDPVTKSIPIGKDGEIKECMVLEEFCDQPVKIRLQIEYSLYNGALQQTKVIRNFFRFTDGATASEIVNNAETKGEQLAKEAEHADKVTYKDGLTEEDVKNYIQNQRNTKNENKDKTPSVGFGQKRSFSKTS